MSNPDPHHIPVVRSLYLSELRSSDRLALVEHLNDEDIYKRTLSIPRTYTTSDADKFLDKVASAAAAHGHPLHFALRDQHDAMIGCCGFEDFHHGHRAEIGYWLARSYWGQGIMTEVVRAASELAVAQWGLVRIFALVFHFNDASARVLEKNGYELEGRVRKHVKKDDEFLDANLFALVK